MLLPALANGQSAPEPDREKLLNGLTILLWHRPGDADVMVKLRIHSGAAFDLAGKGGTMALLGDALFPDPATREYVAEQPGGRLEVATNYDEIDVTISGKADNFERMVEMLRGAVVTTQLSPENVNTIRDARIKRLSEKPLTPAEIADQAIAARLLRKFPYGHPAAGTVETLAKIDRGDLLLARERFLNADNATVVVIGGVEKARVMRTLRQLLGPWGKGDRTVPATFRQPDPPDARVLIVSQPGATTAEIRLAVRGLARSDRDAAVASVLGRIARDLWRLETGPELSSAFVRHESHSLPGIFVMGASVPTASASKAIASAQKVMSRLYQVAPSANELEGWRSAEFYELSHQSSQTDLIAELWLDSKTFKLASHNTQANAIRDVTPADIQRVAARLFKDASVATVVVGNYDQLKSSFDRNIELHSDKPDVKTSVVPATPTNTPAKKP
ncbi:MAG TPA: insulinase family protein [Pyrinomonadaceae bacterium]|nr:insulinase family protein [Pyrinomonadaceae bacterium]